MVKSKEFSQELREIVIEHYKKDKTVNHIYDYLAKKVHKRSINRWIKEYNDHGKLKFCILFFKNYFSK